MPTTRIEPTKFLEHRGVSIYHCYRNGNAGDALNYIYTTDVNEDDAFEFDIRDLGIAIDLGQGPDFLDRAREIILAAIDQELLFLPEGVEALPKTYDRFASLSRETLLQLLASYDRYIQHANDEDLYKSGWRPVCVAEYHDVEF